MGRVSSHLGDRGNRVYLVASNFCNRLSLLSGSMRSLTRKPSIAAFSRNEKRGVEMRMGETGME